MTLKQRTEWNQELEGGVVALLRQGWSIPDATEKVSYGRASLWKRIKKDPVLKGRVEAAQAAALAEGLPARRLANKKLARRANIALDHCVDAELMTNYEADQVRNLLRQRVDQEQTKRTLIRD